MNHQDTFVVILHTHGMRRTFHSQAIFDLFFSTKRLFSAGEIYEAISPHHPRLNLSTVHRILKRFEGMHLVTSIYQERVTLYELSEIFRPHHHHFTCQKCHTVFELGQCSIESIANNIPQASVITSHLIELYGVCKDCMAKENSDKTKHP